MDLNDKLYKFCSTKGIFTYVVTGKLTREQGDFLELECQQCVHSGDQCKVLVAQHPWGGWHFVQMINNDEESHWHVDTERWFERASEALKESFKSRIEEHKKKIISLQDGIRAAEKSIQDYVNYISAMETKEVNGTE